MNIPGVEGAMVEVVYGIAQQPLAPVLYVDHTAHLPTDCKHSLLDRPNKVRACWILWTYLLLEPGG